MDIYTPKRRSEIMSLVRSKSTRPELLLRSALHKLGYRFRVNDKRLPGTPDIVLPKYRTVINVNGCFWHQHPGCRKAKVPATNSDFWSRKLIKNVERDDENERQLRKFGWTSFTVWECQISNIVRLNEILREIRKELGGNKARIELL